MEKIKVVFFLLDLNIGGIETSFIEKINKLDLNKYDITIVMLNKSGVFLDSLPKGIKVINYGFCRSKFVPLRKIINRFKYIKSILLNYHKYDIAVNEVHYNTLCAKLAIKYGKQSIIWVHANITDMYSKEEALQYFKQNQFAKATKLVFVSERALKEYQRVGFSHQELILCHNLIPKFKSSSKKTVKRDEKFTFLNVGRHEENSKKLTRLIDAVEILAKKRQDFIVWLVGSGNSTSLYQNLIKEKNLTKYFKFYGFQKDPAPYYKASDAIIMTSEYEGFPVVYCESMYFKKHLITTDVSDAKLIFNKNQATITKKNPQDIASSMEYVMNNNIKYEPFNIKTYNEEIIKKYDEIFK